jgi:hypothetical protein
MKYINRLYRYLFATAFSLAVIGFPTAVSIMVGAEPAPSKEEAPLPEVIPGNTPTMFVGYLMDPQTKQTKNWTMENREGLAVVDGDIVLGSADELSHPGSSKALLYTRQNLWTKGEVPYVLATDFPKRSMVEAALAEFHANTKIKFVPRTSERNYLNFVLTDNPNIGGQSSLGMVGGEQKLWINRDTAKWNKGTVIHELCHALAFAHEQCRADRDKYVRIVSANIMEGYESQFSQLFNLGRDVGTYDYASNMHYPRNAFTKNGQDTIVPQNNVAIGVRGKLSAGDKEAIAQTYKNEFAKR